MRSRKALVIGTQRSCNPCRLEDNWAVVAEAISDDFEKEAFPKAL